MTDMHDQLQPIPVAPAPPKRRAADRLLVAAAALAIAGVAFGVGRTTAPPAAPGDFSVPGGVRVQPIGSADPGAQPAPGIVGAAGGPTIDGEVRGISADSLTLELDTGETITLALDETTTYHEATEATGSSVAVGDRVAVRIDGAARVPDGAAGGDGGDGPNGPTAADVTVTR